MCFAQYSLIGVLHKKKSFMVKFWENTAYYNIFVECTEGCSIKKRKNKKKYTSLLIYFFKWKDKELKMVCRSRSNRTGHGTMGQFKSEKGVHQGCILSPCLFNFYAENTSCKMPDWMNHKLESRLPGEISTTADVQMIPS